MKHQPTPLLSRVRAAAVALAAVAFASTADAQVDLVAQLVNGPGGVRVEQSVLVTINVGNVGDPLVGDYTAELILTQDFELDDDDDIVVGTDVSDLLVTRTMLATIPVDAPDVQHFWALRVLPAAGETNTANNVIFGSAVIVYATDLELEDPTPIDVFVSESQEPIPPIPVIVNNVGTPGSILIFNAVELTPVSWLTIDPPTSFAIAGEDGNELHLTIDHSLLSPGVHATTVRFRNFQHAADFVDLPVTVNVGAARMVPGDTIIGQMSTPNEVDEIQFTAVEGMKLKLKAKVLAGNLKPWISVVDPDGAVEEILKFKGNGGKKTVKLQRSGEYMLRIEGKKGSLGVYQMKTKAKLPKKAKARKLKWKGLPDGDKGVAEVLMLPGGTLEFSADPNSSFTGPVTLSLTDPSGAMFDVSGFMTTAASGEVAVEGLPIVETGGYMISASGFGGGAKEKLKLTVLPFQPPAGEGKIYLK